MNSESLKYIDENWKTMIRPTAREFEAVFLRSPLKIPWLMIQQLEKRKETISLTRLANLLELHPNTVRSIFRILEGKIFIGYDVANEIEIELREEFKNIPIDQSPVKQRLLTTGFLPGKANYQFREQKNNRYIFLIAMSIM